MIYEIRQCYIDENDFKGIFDINKESNLFATAQFMTSPMSIEKTVKNKKKLLLIAKELKTNDTVGYILGKIKTNGVFFNELLGVKKEYRRKGIGGGLIIALLKLLNQKEINNIKNNFYAWKWFAEVPAYNYEALQMYKSLKFPVEGILRKHTRAKTDIYMLAFFLDEKEIPKYGEHVSNPAKITDKSIFNYLTEKLSDKLITNNITELLNKKTNLNYYIKDKKEKIENKN